MKYVIDIYPKYILRHNEAWTKHDDVIKWKHFPSYWPFVRGIHRSPVNSPHKGQWRGALMFSLICARINGWVNNGEAGDLRRNRAHYDVIVMIVNILGDIFKCIVVNENHCILIWSFFLRFNWRNISIASGKSLASNRRQAITWRTADPYHWHIYAPTSLNVLLMAKDSWVCHTHVALWSGPGLTRHNPQCM